MEKTFSLKVTHSDIILLLGRSLTIFLFLCFSTLAISQNGLMAEYFDGKDFNRFVSATYVSNIDQSWDNMPPVEGIDPNDCSIRWTGKILPNRTGLYLFSARVDDGIRVWIEDKLIIDQWNLNDVGIFNGKIDLKSNTEYQLKVEYFNALREGEVTLLWDMEKPKEEMSWYERVFGVEPDYKVISPIYFLRPDGPLPKSTDKTQLVQKKNEPSETRIVKKTKNDKSPVDKKSYKPPTEKVMTVKEAEKYIPKNIQFQHAKEHILESSHEELNVFAKFMKEHPHVTVKLEGHTDAVGDQEKNLELSERRAFKVARYLVEQGINGKRIKTEGFGGSKPLKKPKKGEYYPENRRVVFILSGLN